MAKIEFLGPISKDSFEAEIQNLNELKAMFKDDETLQEWLSICAVAINDQLVSSLDVAVGPNDKISLLPPVCGG
ncbi:MoaD/ThiS family protein [Sulfurospirillum sp. 1612]|uniref:MoaD/ThiS family protein n=1 Tax=Sulfurospirillum sp. 1612 TaxID=3094835 RepID=UPI002F93CFB7